ncbi:hypothetical protein Bpfe_006357, partial [Biomphalaria pfeifferi]
FISPTSKVYSKHQAKIKMFLKNIQNYFKVLWHCFLRHLWPACHLLKRIKEVYLLPISATFQTNKYTSGAHEIHFKILCYMN